ncbi:hypothetical protein HG530_015295 [Fusarium avenaceum]|nr:hypothetical protein HG530_015295 [Fusarium avenaceum]
MLNHAVGEHALVVSSSFMREHGNSRAASRPQESSGHWLALEDEVIDIPAELGHAESLFGDAIDKVPRHTALPEVAKSSSDTILQEVLGVQERLGLILDIWGVAFVVRALNHITVLFGLDVAIRSGIPDTPETIGITNVFFECLKSEEKSKMSKTAVWI